MSSPVGRCEVTECNIELVGQSVFDKYFKKRICMSCFEKTFRECQNSGFGEWFEKNYDTPEKRSMYPPEFWQSVGAFVDLSKAEIQDPYK